MWEFKHKSIKFAGRGKGPTALVPMPHKAKTRQTQFHITGNRLTAAPKRSLWSRAKDAAGYAQSVHRRYKGGHTRAHATHRAFDRNLGRVQSWAGRNTNHRTRTGRKPSRHFNPDW